MSYAFMRRFAFINIGVPDKVEDTLDEFLGIWDINNFSNDDHKELLSQLWKTINKYREIGPSIAEDIANYISEGGNYIDTIGMYVLPQFEGLEKSKLLDFYQDIAEKDFENLSKLEKVMSDFFEIDPKDFKNE